MKRTLIFLLLATFLFSPQTVAAGPIKILTKFASNLIERIPGVLRFFRDYVAAKGIDQAIEFAQNDPDIDELSKATSGDFKAQVIAALRNLQKKQKHCACLSQHDLDAELAKLQVILQKMIEAANEAQLQLINEKMASLELKLLNEIDCLKRSDAIQNSRFREQERRIAELESRLKLLEGQYGGTYTPQPNFKMSRVIRGQSQQPRYNQPRLTYTVDVLNGGYMPSIAIDPREWHRYAFPFPFFMQPTYPPVFQRYSH